MLAIMPGMLDVPRTMLRLLGPAIVPKGCLVTFKGFWVAGVGVVVYLFSGSTRSRKGIGLPAA